MGTATKPKVEHTMLVATELTTEDMLEVFVDLAKNLTYKLDKAEKERDEWKRTFEIYDNAWTREVQPYGFIAQHKHRIDSFVITTQTIVREALQWKRHVAVLAERAKDPFWSVPAPQPKRDKQEE